MFVRAWHCRQMDQQGHAVAAPAFLNGEAKGRAKTFLGGGQVYMVANNALSQYGTHTECLLPSQVFLPFPLISTLFLFASCATFSFPSLFHSHFPPLPSFYTARRSRGVL